MRICYHGTDPAAASLILKEGFKDGTWFAANLQDALGFGGLCVFEVAFDKDSPDWQFTAPPVKPDRIVSYAVYTKSVSYDNDKLRQEIFESNIGQPLPVEELTLFLRGRYSGQGHAPEHRQPS